MEIAAEGRLIAMEWRGGRMEIGQPGIVFPGLPCGVEELGKGSEHHTRRIAVIEDDAAVRPHQTEILESRC